MWRADVKLNMETLQGDIAYILNQEESKSGKMKLLFDIGLSVKEITEIMQVRYNFVYNVISNYVTIKSIPTEKQQMDSKKGQIIELFLKGKTNREISKELKLNYNYIYKVIREYAEKNTEAYRPATGAAQPVPQVNIQRPESKVLTVDPEPEDELLEQIGAITEDLKEEVTPEVRDQGVIEIEEPIPEPEVSSEAVNQTVERVKVPVEMPEFEKTAWKPPAGTISKILTRRSR